MEDIETLDRKKIAQRLKLVLDPEVGLNVVDLGLVYDIVCDESSVKVKITMTTMGCPMTRYIQMSMKNVLSKIPGVEHFDIEIVWSPAWSPKMINPEVLSRR